VKTAFNVLGIIVLFGCTVKQSTDIIIPELKAGFYQEALATLDEKLADDPLDLGLIEQKVFYCEEANWPTTCLSALDQLKSTKGMSRQLFGYYLSYYAEHELSANAVALFDQWGDTYSTAEFRQTLIKSFVTLGRKKEAIAEIRVLLAESPGLSNSEFVSRQYLQMADTLMSIYFMTKVWKDDPSSSLMLDYGKVLISKGYSVRGLKVLQTLQEAQDWDQTDDFELAAFYESMGYNQQALKLLKLYTGNKEVDFRISDLFRKESLLDSSIMYLDTVLMNDPGNFIATKLKAETYEQKGWLSTSLRFYEQAYAMDSTDTVIRDRVDLIQRKIAYLQRQKFEESRLPLLQLEPKKINNE